VGAGACSDLECAGLVKIFEFSFELWRKTLNGLLFCEGYGVRIPRPVIRKSFAAGYIDEEDCEILFQY